MAPQSPAAAGLVLVGRSSSHFTRVPRIVAAEIGVDYTLRPLRDLTSTDPEDYGGNPALKLPTLLTPEGAWFGAVNICRELDRRAPRRARVVWPEELTQPLLADAQELTLHAMSTEVSLLMGKAGGLAEESAHYGKLHRSLSNTMSWLEEHVAAVVGALPAERDLSLVEVMLFCLVTHLEFRAVLPVAGYAELGRFCQRFGARAACAATAYRFDFA